MGNLDSALVAVRLDIDMLHQIDEFIKNGVFSDLKAAIEYCILEYFQKHTDLLETQLSNWFDILKPLKEEHH